MPKYKYEVKETSLRIIEIEAESEEKAEELLKRKYFHQEEIDFVELDSSNTVLFHLRKI